ncbi:antibiotic biosynthesis monooxygenase family protein [Helcococcus kunzii]|uniref:antibiotic biosynthesis monooxygenase family protein n=1 Tax=Helcococcus kunzii TaxID=40091 RepID=UPI0021A7DA54|nr:antibiotic biosynthesis monooxygenase [Helcococcus kunzii]MCT1796787.1 antibiotic biosynthesis monooxygenase [Helcococcus kunzii]MCT1988345.1 antibiotic biosynthesis monooxygenase [Helcococcus kunzii]
MAITVNIYYIGEGDNAINFAKEMISSGVVKDIKAQKGNIRYDYFVPIDKSDTVLLVDSWENQEAIDKHHNSPMMVKILELREKYDLRMHVERYITDDEIPEKDREYIRE